MMTTDKLLRYTRGIVLASVGLVALGFGLSTQADQTWSYTYNANGQVLTADGPRSDVSDITTNTYDAAGNLISTTNALGHVTQLQDYNGRGQAGKLIDPNGVVTLLNYNARGWLLTSTVKDPGGNTAQDAVTTYGYDNVGQVTIITLPNGSVLNYEYDAAQRLAAISNGLGERIEYTLDLAGNQTGETIKSSTGTITKTLSRTYDELSRLLSVVGAGGQTTSYAYDTNGNVTNVTDGNLNQTVQGYDALDRLVTDDAPLNHSVDYFYDAQDNLAQVTDPKGLATLYEYDGFGNLVRLESPDTGITTYTYDDADNRLSQTDAEGVTTTFTYDALNRLTGINYPNSGLNVTYTYDEGAHGKGRLTGISDGSGSTTLVYDHRGNLTSQTNTIDGNNYTVNYAYNLASQLIQIVYPSGRSVDYSYDTEGLVSQVDTTFASSTQTLANNFDYLPFGPLTQLDYGNGIQLTGSFDADYRLDLLDHSAVKQTDYAYDNADNITGIVNNTNNAADQSFDYDALNRLTNATGIYGDLSYTYDENGNRLTFTDSTGTDSYTYDANSHRLLNTDDWTYAYDANGNRISKLDAGDSGLLYIYDDHNRLIEVQDAQTTSTLASYAYNAFGQRVSKSAGGTDTHYLYGPGGQLLAELDATGASLRDYLYLNSQPLAVADYSGASQPGEVIVDNGAASFSDNWPVSTSVAGFEGANYQYHAGGSVGPGALGDPVDNTQASLAGTWPTSTSVAGYHGSNYQYHAGDAAGPGQLGTPVDNSAATFTGTWPNSTSVKEYLNSNYQYHAAGTGQNTATWALSIASAGSYDVYATWTAHSNRATDAQYTISHSSGTDTVTVNQQNNGGAWQLLGTYNLDAASQVSLSDDANGYVIADAVTVLPAGTPPTPTPLGDTATWALSVASAGSYDVYATWTAHPNRATDAQYTISHSSGTDTVTVNQQNNGGAWQLLGTYNLDSASQVSLSSVANGYVIADAVTALPAGTPATPDVQGETATWAIGQVGEYEVYAKWTAHANRATDAQYTVTHAGGSDTITVNQQSGGGQWMSLGTYTLDASSTVSLSSIADGYVVADAVRLVATTPPAPTGSTIYYSHNDHLGTPQAFTDQNQIVVWQADYQPFGEVNETINTFANNLRFPGQYYDAETGQHYNYFRDYDPVTGRYVQSDPIGLVGGINTYEYVSGNPLRFVDPVGLWSFSISAYGGLGGGVDISTSGGTWEITGRVGVGLGGGITFDPKGKISPHSKNSGSGYIGRTATNAGVGAGIGIVGTGASFKGATGNGFTTKVGGGYTSTFGTAQVGWNPKNGFGVRGELSVNAEFGSYTNWGSPSVVNDDILRRFCEQNPTAPNCKDDCP